MRRTSALITCMLILLSSLFISYQTSSAEGITRIDPVDDPELPPIGFFKGILPTPSDGESFGSAYENTSSHSQFVPIWGKPSPFYNLSDDLEGWWGDTFVDDLVRGNGMFPLVHMNFFRKDDEEED